VTIPLVRHSDAALHADPARVIARLFLPGEERPLEHSRAGAVVARVMAVPEIDVEQQVAQLLADFAGRHRNYAAMLSEHAAMVSSHVQHAAEMSSDRALLMGACFTAEYAVEGAALCNPSAVLHPIQDGLQPGQARLTVSLRGIGEGHVSSIGFATAVVGPGASWSFEPRALPAVTASSTAASWHREHLRAVLADQGHADELAYSVLTSLPDAFTPAHLQSALAGAHRDLRARSGSSATIAVLRQLVASAYEVAFPEGVELSQRVLLPAADEERNGMEDARFARFAWFARFTAADGTTDYRATYTAYDGHQITPRLLTSPDLRVFRAHRLAGPAARNKGMALFPRLVRGRHVALCRSDGECTSLATSVDGLVWGEPELIQAPEASWELLQVGNCGPPIETAHGWLVLTHGVGPMRTYAIGAILLDLEQPTRVLSKLDAPLLRVGHGQQDGYVPNVVYSCGAVVHDGSLWLP
jgi:beta-1,4-mannooligosaccharide phosphorylase